jgi:hypothetical protein
LVAIPRRSYMGSRHHGVPEARRHPDALDIPVVTADWTEDIAHLPTLMVTDPGYRMPSPKLVFELLDLPLFDSLLSSDVPHNAYYR